MAIAEALKKDRLDAGPWYCEPWPWLLMLGPALVIVAAGFTAWLAISSADGLVADDYYKQGLAINRELARDSLAAKQGLHATARFEHEEIRVELGKGPADPPAALTLNLLHPTRAGLDRNITLLRQANGEYAGRMTAPAPGRWRVTIEQRDWRLTGLWQAPFGNSAELGSGW